MTKYVNEILRSHLAVNVDDKQSKTESVKFEIKSIVT